MGEDGQRQRRADGQIDELHDTEEKETDVSVDNRRFASAETVVHDETVTNEGNGTALQTRTRAMTVVFLMSSSTERSTATENE